MCVVGSVLLVACCVLIALVVRCLWCVLYVVRCCCVLLVAWCSHCADCSVMFAVVKLAIVVYCVLFVVCRLLFIEC